MAGRRKRVSQKTGKDGLRCGNGRKTPGQSERIVGTIKTQTSKVIWIAPQGLVDWRSASTSRNETAWRSVRRFVAGMMLMTGGAAVKIKAGARHCCRAAEQRPL